MSRPDEPNTCVLEIRTYKIVPGGRDDFDRIFREGALPMLHRHGVQVVGYGPSIDDDDHYYLMRTFASLSRREEQLDSFYGSDEWRQNYEAVVMPLIESYHTVVIELADAMGDREAAVGTGEAVAAHGDRGSLVSNRIERSPPEAG
jgi:hypothetical protein